MQVAEQKFNWYKSEWLLKSVEWQEGFTFSASGTHTMWTADVSKGKVCMYQQKRQAEPSVYALLKVCGFD